MARDEPQGAPLARAADEDRDALLQRPRIADGLRDAQGAPVEARRARAPHERQQLERVLEPRVALGERRELPAVEAVLALEPSRPDPAHGAPAGEHVERRDDLREVRDVAVGDAGDERAEPDALGHAREVGEGGVALEHVLPLATDLRDLHEVVHDPEAGEARVLGRPRDLGERVCRRLRVAGPVEARDLQPEVERHRILLLAGGGAQGGQEGGGHERNRARAVHAGEILAGEPLSGAGRLAQLRGDHARRHGRLPGAIAGADHGLGHVEQDRVGGHAMVVRERPPGGAPLGLEPGRVDHRGQTTAQPLGHDQVEHLERVAARALVALARADHGAQPVRRHDLIGVEPRVRPVRLARCGRPDEHDEARIRQPQRRALGQRLRHDAGPTTALRSAACARPPGDRRSRSPSL